MFDAAFVRTEVWHALSVHFPIALLLFSTFALLISFVIKVHHRRPWYLAGCGLLFVGVISGWISIYTGNLADGIVSRKLCDPTILKDHEIAAQTAIYLFTSAMALIVLQIFRGFKSVARLVFAIITGVLMLVGSGYLLYAGHLGASLVYQQGAGVYKHDVDCAEFE
jgi:uncharacterized membrane protein